MSHKKFLQYSVTLLALFVLMFGLAACGAGSWRGVACILDYGHCQRYVPWKSAGSSERCNGGSIRCGSCLFPLVGGLVI